MFGESLCCARSLCSWRGSLFTSAVLAFLVMGLITAGPAASQQDIPINCVENVLFDLPEECESFSFQILLNQVTQTNGILGGAVPGEILEGTFTVYNATPDVEALPDAGVYVNALECVTLNFDDRTLSVDLDPVEVEIPASESDPGIRVTNDTEESTEIGSFFTDLITFSTAGAGAITLEGSNGAGVIGGGGFAFGYGDSCLSPFQSPCPPTIITNDDLPGAPGDLSQTTGAALMTFDFLTLQSEIAAGQATVLSINPLPPIACPEPGVALSIALLVPMIALLGRRRF